MRTQSKIYSKRNAPESVPVPSGKKVYKWERINPTTKKVETAESNVHEKIQSFMSMVDYKKKIANGEELEIPVDNGFIKDYRSIPDTSVDIIKLANTLSNLSQEEISLVLQQGNQGIQEAMETQQTINQDTQTSGETAPGSVDTNTPSSEGSGN